MFLHFNFSSIFPGGQLTPFARMCGRPWLQPHRTPRARGIFVSSPRHVNNVQKISNSDTGLMAGRVCNPFDLRDVSVHFLETSLTPANQLLWLLQFGVASMPAKRYASPFSGTSGVRIRPR